MDCQPDAKMFSYILPPFLYFIFIKIENVAPARRYPGLEASTIHTDWHAVI